MGDINAPGYWDAAYREERDGWDMGTPTPVFADLLTRLDMDFRSLGALHFAQLGHPPRVLIPCSGRGYDALLFAGRGWEVTAVDFAAEPLEWLRAEARHAGLPVTVLQEDMFSLAHTHAASYDLIVEYTCVCAIDPARRQEFLEFSHAVLRPGGILMALLFPVDGRPGGPPFSIDVEEFKREAASRFSLAHESTPGTSVKPRLGKERLLIWQKGKD
ncbi:methyltransferase domain-containing protein [bacterium]|nr:methyltransferase domain-containing protein [bacterium]